MSLALELLQAIDERIAKYGYRDTAVGTVASRSFDLWATVMFDGSAVAVPVKVFADVACYTGDRVGLQKFGGDWVVVGNFTHRWPSEAGLTNQNATAGSTTGTTRVDMPGSPTITFVKRWDTTRVQIFMGGTWYSDQTATKLGYGVRLVGNTSYEVNVGAFYSNEANSHKAFAATQTTTTPIAAGVYSVVARWWVWESFTGTAAVVTDGNDFLSFGCREITPSIASV